MKVGLYVSHIGVPEAFADNVSGHIQIPLKVLDMLQATYHYPVVLFTNTLAADQVYPSMMPADATVHHVVDGRVRSAHGQKQKGGVRPLKLVRQIIELIAGVRRHEVDVIHFWGFDRTLDLAAIVARLMPRVPVVATPYSVQTPRLSGARRRLWGSISLLVASTEFTAGKLRGFGLPCTYAPHPAVKDLGLARDQRAEVRDMVLFWRELTDNNGADLAADAFNRLAGEYPDILFVFAVRRWAIESAGIRDVVERHPNLLLYRFPYPPGLGLQQLLSRSICAVLPFRVLTIEPQMSILETLQAGVPVIATNLGSVPEYVVPGETGILVDKDDHIGLFNALKQYLDNRSLALEHGKRARESVLALSWPQYVNELSRQYARLTGSSRA